MYTPQSQTTDGFLILVVKAATGRPEILAGPIRRIIRDLDPAIPVDGISGMTELVDRAAAQQRFVMRLLAGFAAGFCSGAGVGSAVSGMLGLAGI